MEQNAPAGYSLDWLKDFLREQRLAQVAKSAA
jgi:hypothetical protein